MLGTIGVAFVAINVVIIAVWVVESQDGKTQDSLADRYRKILKKIW